MVDCIYCNISLRSDHEVLLNNDYCIYSLLKEQEIEGAGIIVPINHKETVFDLSQEEWNATYQLLQDVKHYINPAGQRKIKHRKHKEHLYALEIKGKI
jgi:histidine triad (HIT) family protein